MIYWSDKPTKPISFNKMARNAERSLTLTVEEKRLLLANGFPIPVVDHYRTKRQARKAQAELDRLLEICKERANDASKVTVEPYVPTQANTEKVVVSESAEVLEAGVENKVPVPNDIKRTL